MIALAIHRRAAPLAAAQNNYKKNVVTVNTLMTSVLSSNLPTLNETPPDWQEFSQALEQAKSGALNWVNNVMARLLAVPGEVRNYRSLINQILASASTQAAALVADPTNTMAREILLRNLDDLLSQLTLVRKFIEGALGQVQKFKDDLPPLAASLKTIADRSIAAAQADQGKIESLQNDINQLQQHIHDLTASIVALSIVDGIALIIGVVATIAAWPAGALVWFVLAPAVAVATTFIALDAEKIKADKAAISRDQERMSGLTADVSTLTLLAHNFETMTQQAEALETNLAAILAEWQTLENDMNAAVSETQAAITDTHKPDYAAVKRDLEKAQEEWDAAVAQAGALHLDLQVNPAQLKLGMSQEAVQEALAKKQPVPIITYYNQVGTA